MGAVAEVLDDGHAGAQREQVGPAAGDREAHEGADPAAVGLLGEVQHGADAEAGPHRVGHLDAEAARERLRRGLAVRQLEPCVMQGSEPGIERLVRHH